MAARACPHLMWSVQERGLGRGSEPRAGEQPGKMEVLCLLFGLPSLSLASKMSGNPLEDLKVWFMHLAHQCVCVGHQVPPSAGEDG